MKTRTITISDRRPVQIDEDKWPIVAKADDFEHDGKVLCQANERHSWIFRARQHKDGRAIVYAIYDYSSNYEGARNISAKHGQLLPKGSSMDDVVAAIRSVQGRMAECEHHEDDAKRWTKLADECIADLPAERLS